MAEWQTSQTSTPQSASDMDEKKVLSSPQSLDATGKLAVGSDRHTPRSAAGNASTSTTAARITKLKDRLRSTLTKHNVPVLEHAAMTTTKPVSSLNVFYAALFYASILLL